MAKAKSKKPAKKPKSAVLKKAAKRPPKSAVTKKKAAPRRSAMAAKIRRVLKRTASDFSTMSARVDAVDQVTAAMTERERRCGLPQTIWRKQGDGSWLVCQLKDDCRYGDCRAAIRGSSPYDAIIDDD